MTKKRCDGQDTDIFFPNTEAGEAVAKAYCRECQVRTWCLEVVALPAEGSKAKSGRHGIFGGLNPEERANLVRARKRPSQARGPSSG